MTWFLFILFLCLPVHLNGSPGDGSADQSVVRLTPEQEPGRPFTLGVTVLSIETRQPIRGAAVFVYQTNHVGDYENDENGVARIHGTAVSDENGQVMFHTIYPRGYDDSPTGEHMHFRVTAAGFQRSVADLIFADYYRDRYDFHNPYTYKVYLKRLEKSDKGLVGEALIYLDPQ